MTQTQIGNNLKLRKIISVANVLNKKTERYDLSAWDKFCLMRQIKFTFFGVDMG